MVKYLPSPLLAVRKRFGQIFAFGALWRCCRGATAVEFAICAPVLLYLVCGTMEYGLIMTLDSLIEGGIRQGARCGITGNGSNGATVSQPICAGGSSSITDRASAIVAAVNTATSGLVTINASNVSMKVYPTFASITGEPYVDQGGVGSYVAGDPYTDLNGNGSYDGPQTGTTVTDGGQSGDIVLYTVTANWTLITPGLNNLIAGHQVYGGNTSTFPLKATVVVRNEPY